MKVNTGDFIFDMIAIIFDQGGKLTTTLLSPPHTDNISGLGKSLKHALSCWYHQKPFIMTWIFILMVIYLAFGHSL